MDLKQKFLELKARKDAVVLCHNYQVRELQDVADYVGDSYGLAVEATRTKAKLILFLGVDFMAETAAILNPEKKVIVPTKSARCPMADMLDADIIWKYKSMYPDAAVAVYVNTKAMSKALADVVVTSSNAVDVCRRLKQRQILFGPDRNLALYVQKSLPEKEIIPMPKNGYCHVHKDIDLNLDLVGDKDGFVEFLAHPECDIDVQEGSDFVGSTEKMRMRPKVSDAGTFVVGTEVDLAYRMQRLYPDRNIYPMSDSAVCVNMKKNTLSLAYNALLYEKNVVAVDKAVACKARVAIEKMLEFARKPVQNVIVKVK